jgi:hypothetical protein
MCIYCIFFHSATIIHFFWSLMIQFCTIRFLLFNCFALFDLIVSHSITVWLLLYRLLFDYLDHSSLFCYWKCIPGIWCCFFNHHLKPKVNKHQIKYKARPQYFHLSIRDTRVSWRPIATIDISWDIWNQFLLLGSRRARHFFYTYLEVHIRLGVIYIQLLYRIDDSFCLFRC